MRDATDVTVQRAIVHILDNRKKKLTLSETELTLEGYTELRKYFSDQVKNALADDQTSSARFSSDGEQAAIRECFSILADGQRFIPASRELAQLLFGCMEHERISPGSLAICLYTAANYPETNFLALIKIDPVKALVQKVAKQDGKQVVSFDERGDVMPTTNEKLHKAALIPPSRSNKDFDLLLLDRQVAAVAANFFAYKFLNTIPALDARTSTKQLYLAAQNAYNRLVSPAAGPLHIGPQEADALQQHIQVAFQSPSVNVDSWVRKLPISKGSKSVVAEEIKQLLPQEKRIEIDRDYARDKLLTKTRFRGEYGVLFEVKSEYYKDVVKNPKEIRRPDGKIVTRLVIEVPGLQWVKR